MKKILAIAAAAALTAGVSAYAANPFSDVSTNDWAYQAVADLSDQGVVIGYPDGTFRGERNITRYELAQIVARMMAREDQLNAEQRATLEKLANEYADELANLGVRVSKLEKKVGNLYWSGDARMRFQDKALTEKDNWDGRIRINVKADVNESTTVNGRLVSTMKFKDSNDAKVEMDVLNVRHQFGKEAAVTVGRYANMFGNQGGWLYGAKTFDGAQVQFGLGKFSATVGYGQFNGGSKIKDKDVLYAKGKADFGVAKLDLNYIADKDSKAADRYEIMGAGLVVPVEDFRVFGEYWKNTTAKEYDKAWNAGIGYGKFIAKKPGTFSIDVAYNDVDQGLYAGKVGSVLGTDALDYLAKQKNVTFWNAIAKVALLKNAYLQAEYAFDVDAKDVKDEDDAWAVSLNYKF